MLHNEPTTQGIPLVEIIQPSKLVTEARKIFFESGEFLHISIAEFARFLELKVRGRAVKISVILAPERKF